MRVDLATLFDECGGDPEKVIARLREEAPELVEILDAAKEGTLTFDDALMEMARRTALASPSVATKCDLPGDLFLNEVGRPQMNPLVQAALAERLQFDEDVPEMRTGDLPEGVKPAVSVRTNARSPVALGLMLERASNAVDNEVRQHQKARAALVEDLAAGRVDTTALIAKGETWLARVGDDPDFGDLVQGSPETDLALYRRGEVPAPVEVAKPSGSALAALTPEQRREAAYKFLSTTQGRRSAVDTIRELVAVKLRGGTFGVVEREFDPTREVEVKAVHEWAVNIHGKGSVKETFSLIETASAALASGILRTLPGDMEGTFYLEVTPKNTVDVRSVGWAARLTA